MSDENKFFPEDKELEAELRRLMPSRLKVDFIDELARDHDRLVAQKKDQGRVRSKWLIPTMAACLLVLFVSTYWKIRSGSIAANADKSSANSEPSLVATEPTGNKPILKPRLVPVSSQGYLINASSDGIIESAHGPQERFNLNYEDVDVWHDPDTSTNIRIFSPRQETLVVPLETY